MADRVEFGKPAPGKVIVPISVWVSPKHPDFHPHDASVRIMNNGKVTGSGLEYAGLEEITVKAGTFECHHVLFRGLTNNHPPYHMWISTCGDYLYVKGTVDGYMNSTFELVEIEGQPLS